MNLPAKLKHIMVLTGEPSGDLHAGRLVEEIKNVSNAVYFSGIGGPNLEKMNVDLFYNIETLSAMGVTEVIMQFGHIKKAFDRFKEKLKVHTPDLIILVDYPGFNLTAARFAKTHYHVKILYYITPKVWAWKRSRLKKIKKYVDHAALILPFEEKIFKQAKVPATYVGNPLVDEYPENLSLTFPGPDPIVNKKKEPCVIGLLPGSRTAEIKNLLEVMVKAACLIFQQEREVVFIISRAGSIKTEHFIPILDKFKKDICFQIHDGPVKEILLQSDLVIAASGTVTLEAALCCVPTIIIYKMSAISFKIATLFVKIKYAGLANLIVDREVMPELLQQEASPEKISKKALYMLEHLNYFQNQLKSVRKLIGNKGASKRAANIAVNMLRD